MSERELHDQPTPAGGTELSAEQHDAQQTQSTDHTESVQTSVASQDASTTAAEAAQQPSTVAEQPPSSPQSAAAAETTPQQSQPAPQPTVAREPQPFEKIPLPPQEEKPAPVVVTDELLARLQSIMERGEPITVHVAQRVRGGLRVYYEGIKMFLPAAQFFLKKMPTDAELEAAVGTDIPVHILEIVKDEVGKISFIVGRKKLLREQFYSKLKVGDVVEGTVTAVKDFGLFVDLGGFEGLVHISRVSHQTPTNLAELYKVGDVVRAQVIEIDHERDKISLSIKALEPSPWKSVAERYRVGERYTGTVRRLVPYGAFIELEPGIEGLVRLRELSWTRRITNPAEVLREGQQVEVVVIDIKPEQEQIDLSLRQTMENPWPALAAKYPPGFHTTGVVRAVLGSGVLLTVGGEVDAFMPRSQMRPVLRGKRIPYSVGDIVAVTVVEVVPETESFIVAPRVEPEEELFGPPRDATPAASPKPKSESRPTTNPTKITIGELLSEEERQRLFGSSQQ